MNISCMKTYKLLVDTISTMVFVLVQFWVSTHVVCERLSAMHYHIPVTRIFGWEFLEFPHSSISGMLVWSTPTPNENLAWLRDFGFELVWSTTPPPSPPPMKIWPDCETLDFSWSVVPPPPNVNLARLRDFGFQLVWITTPPHHPHTWELVCGD